MGTFLCKPVSSMKIRYTMIIMLVLISGIAFAQSDATAPIAISIADSILLQREKEIISEYGFRDRDKLSVVAQKLEIKDLAKWKQYLGYEEDNHQVEEMSLRKLGITPYKVLLAKQFSIYGFTEQSSISDVADALKMPIKKLKLMLGLKNPNSRQYDDSSLQALELSPEQAQKAADEFKDNSIAYGLSITGVGMAIVFLALVITSLIVGQLKHLNREPKAKKADLKLGPGGKVRAASTALNQDLIVALIATLHIHKQSIEDKRKLALTFRRTPTNQWRASSFLRMPNRELNITRK